MKKILLLSLVCFTLLSSCKKDNPDNGNGSGTTSEELVEITTSFGKMYVWLHKQTPKHRENFLKIASNGVLENTTFHRLVDNFVIQGGDPLSKDANPNNDGTGGPGYTIPAEILDTFKHVVGAIGAARLSDDVNPSRASSGSQFYIVMARNSNSIQLDGAYTIFGQVVKGMDVASQIAAQPKNNQNGRPNTNIPMTTKVLKLTKAEILTLTGFQVP